MGQMESLLRVVAKNMLCQMLPNAFPAPLREPALFTRANARTAPEYHPINSAKQVPNCLAPTRPVALVHRTCLLDCSHFPVYSLVKIRLEM